MSQGPYLSVAMFADRVVREFDAGLDTQAIAVLLGEKEFMIERALHIGLDRRYRAKQEVAQ